MGFVASLLIFDVIIKVHIQSSKLIWDVVKQKLKKYNCLMINVYKNQIDFTKSNIFSRNKFHILVD